LTLSLVLLSLDYLRRDANQRGMNLKKITILSEHSQFSLNLQTKRETPVSGGEGLDKGGAGILEASVPPPYLEMPAIELQGATLGDQIIFPQLPSVPLPEGAKPLTPRGSLDNISSCRDVAQTGSAPEWGSGGRRFKSSRPDHELAGIIKRLAEMRLSAFLFPRGFSAKPDIKF
jgi:hypothetical protein